MAEAGDLIRAVRKLDATVDASEMTGDQLLELGTKKGIEYSTAAARLIKFKSKLALMGGSKAATAKVLLGKKDEEMGGAGYGHEGGSSGDDSDDNEDNGASGDQNEDIDTTDDTKGQVTSDVAVSGPFGSAHEIRHQRDIIAKQGTKGLLRS